MLIRSSSAEPDAALPRAHGWIAASSGTGSSTGPQSQWKRRRGSRSVWRSLCALRFGRRAMPRAMRQCRLASMTLFAALSKRIRRNRLDDVLVVHRSALRFVLQPHDCPSIYPACKTPARISLGDTSLVRRTAKKSSSRCRFSALQASQIMANRLPGRPPCPRNPPTRTRSSLCA